MKFIITGGQGQIAKALDKSLSLLGHEVHSLSRQNLNICDEQAIHKLFSSQFDILINCAAWTDVELCENYSELAYQTNAEALKYMGHYAKKYDRRIIHLSSNYVFDGLLSRPYKENDEPNPISVYGKTKLEGERFLFEEASENALILRLSWVFSEYPGCNFLLKFLRVLERLQTVKVVDDQTGGPTSAYNVAKIINLLSYKISIGAGLGEIFHYADVPDTTWYSYAQAIVSEGKDIELIPETNSCYPVSSDMYKTIAKRPACGLLDSEKIAHFLEVQPYSWVSDLRKILLDVKNL